MKSIWLLPALAPLLASCAQPFAIRFPDCAFPTRQDQKVVIVTGRGRTEVHGVVGSRDIVVRGTVQTMATSLQGAQRQAQAVKVIDTSTPAEGEPVLRLEVIGTPTTGTVLLESEFLVPRDVRLEIQDGPEDLLVRELDAGITIVDKTGNIEISSIRGPVDIDDQDGDIVYIVGNGPVRVSDRRGDVVLEEITGDIDLTDREGDALIQTVTGNLVLSKNGRGNVRVNNLDGHFEIREWQDNPTKPLIDTIWFSDREAKPIPANPPPGKEVPAAPTPARAKEDSLQPPVQAPAKDGTR